MSLICFCCGRERPPEELSLIIELGFSRSKVKYCRTCREVVAYYEGLILKDPHQVLGFDYANFVALETKLDECIGLEGKPNPLLRIQIAQRAIALAINMGSDSLPDFHRKVLSSGMDPELVFAVLSAGNPQLVASS